MHKKTERRGEEVGSSGATVSTPKVGGMGHHDEHSKPVLQLNRRWKDEGAGRDHVDELSSSSLVGDLDSSTPFTLPRHTSSLPNCNTQSTSSWPTDARASVVALQGEIQALAAGEDRVHDQLEDKDVQAGRVKEVRAQKYVGAARKGDVGGCGASLRVFEVGRCRMSSLKRESKYFMLHRCFQSAEEA